MCLQVCPSTGYSALHHACSPHDGEEAKKPHAGAGPQGCMYAERQHCLRCMMGHRNWQGLGRQAAPGSALSQGS